jgi:uncharacterized protein YdcH (DUF465 family)
VKINLRKAGVLKESITDAINNIAINTDIELTEFQDVAAALQGANDTLFENDTRRQQLLLAYYNVESLIRTAETSVGIDVLKAKSAFAENRIVQITEIANVDPLIDVNIIAGKLEKIKNRSKEEQDTSAEVVDTVYTSVVSSQQIEQAKAEIKNLKKQKQALEDEILELILQTEIPLSEEVAECLQLEGIL